MGFNAYLTSLEIETINMTSPGDAVGPALMYQRLRVYRVFDYPKMQPIPETPCWQ